MRADGYWKLTEADLKSLVVKGLIDQSTLEEIIRTSQARHPDRHADQMKSVWLNKSETIRLQSIHFYGGENFGQPFHWQAEIVAFTTHSALTQFFNRHHLKLPHMFY